jgi:hypothetical protein
MKSGRRRNAGHTVLEVAITAALMGLVLGGLLLMTSANQKAYRTGSVAADLESLASATMDRLVRELEVAVLDSLSPIPDGDWVAELEYRHATLGEGVVDLGPLRKLALDYDTGEVGDGLDNNNNGLVDERRLVLTEDVGGPNERSFVLTRWIAEWQDGEQPNSVDDNGNDLVDEPGFFVVRSGESLTLYLTLQKRIPEGLLMTRVATTSVRLRN